MSRPRTLNTDDHQLIRLVARCHSNDEIAAMLGIPRPTLRARLNALHKHLGTSGQGHDAIISRVRMVAWAYENGLMDEEIRLARPDAGVVDASLPGELLDLCRAIVADRPRGDLRKLAARALRIEGGKR